MAKKKSAVPPAVPKFKTKVKAKDEEVHAEPTPQSQQGQTIPQTITIDVGSILKRINPVGLDDMVQKAQDTGDPIFTIDDLKTTRNPLALIMRLLFIQERMTKKKFEYLHRKMAQESVMPTNAMSYNRNNIMRSLPQSDYTWNFTDKLLGICGFTLLDISLTLQKNDTKEVFTISQSEALNAIKDNPYPPNVVVSSVTKVEE